MIQKLMGLNSHIIISITLFGLCFSYLTNSTAQTGSLQGKIIDNKTGEGIPFANINLTVPEGNYNDQTDFDGIYHLDSIPAGTYSLNISFVGYKTIVLKQIIVPYQTTVVNVEMMDDSQIIYQFIARDRHYSLKRAETSTGATYTKEEINKMPIR